MPKGIGYGKKDSKVKSLKRAAKRINKMDKKRNKRSGRPARNS